MSDKDTTCMHAPDKYMQTLQELSIEKTDMLVPRLMDKVNVESANHNQGGPDLQK